MFFPVLELIDRLCIARLKWENTKANKSELDWYEEQWSKFESTIEMENHINQLMEIHKEIWKLEWQLKSGVEHQLSLEDIGRNAIAIRDWNNKRLVVKNSAAQLLGCNVREIKKDHLSE
jgi:hypothetical protein